MGCLFSSEPTPQYKDTVYSYRERRVPSFETSAPSFQQYGGGPSSHESRSVPSYSQSCKTDEACEELSNKLGELNFSHLRTQPASESRSITDDKRVEINTRILTELLQDDNYKFERNPNRGTIFSNELEPTDLDFLRVRDHFKQTNKSFYKIRKILRLESAYLYAQFKLKYLSMSMEKHTKVEELYHGTNYENVTNICVNNFNWRYIRKHKFGKGVSFTPISYYATHYSDKTYNKIMFVASVIVGNKCVGSNSIIVPYDDYDTTTNEKEDVIVKYDDFSFYPEYIISYQGKDVSKRR